MGGVPEVLPHHMILFGRPEEDDLVQTLNRAISIIESKDVSPFDFHEAVKQMYNWGDVAERTEKVFFFSWSFNLNTSYSTTQVYEQMRQLEPYPLIDRLRL